MINFGPENPYCENMRIVSIPGLKGKFTHYISVKRNMAIAALLSFVPAIPVANAEKPLLMELSATSQGSSGGYAPYFIGSLSESRDNMKSSDYIGVKLWKDIDSTARFSYGFGGEVMGGWFHDMTYRRYIDDEGLAGYRSWRPGAIRIQQLYGSLKYRSLSLNVGMKTHHSVIVDDNLSSGDVTYGINIRPIPCVEAGFIDFQNIPFTKEWVQITGAVAYGRTMDGGYQDDMMNRRSGSYNPYTYFTYKYLHFRTKPSEPFSVVLGLQAGGMFDGTTKRYRDGKIYEEDRRGLSAKNFFKMLVPIEGNGDDYYEGNTVGSWDLRARYRFRGGHELAGYFEWLFEDGSGVGKLNGWDGLWGLEFKPAAFPWIKGVAVEYLDFTNQSGPFHFSKPTTPGSTIQTDCGGADDYYNNGYYGPYAYYGMSIGSPFIMSPFYNKDGTNYFIYNRTRGFHFAVRGDILPGELSYRIKVMYQKAYGGGSWLLRRPLRNGSALGELGWNADRLLKGLRIKGMLAIDHGGLRGNNFGALVSVSYTAGIASLKH